MEVRYNDDGTADVTNRSIFTRQVHVVRMNISREQFENWYFHNVPIQIALPDLTAAEREFLMTGVTREEWDRMLKDDLDDED
jgi:hypothetical protein